MIVALTGATGFIGAHLAARLKGRGYSVRALGRRNPRTGGVDFAQWDSSREPPVDALRDAGAVIHLAGEPVAQRWTAEAKRRIHDSRIDGTRHLVDALGKLSPRPSTLIAASAIGYYGDRGEEVLTESASPGSDFLAQTCEEWERESRRAADFGVRVVLVRIGVVLGREGGALKKMLAPFKAGVGGPVGSGQQWMSWIHIDDVVGLIAFALDNSRVSGPMNAAAPGPVRNAEFTRALAAALHRPAIVPVPAFGLKLLFGEMASVVLASQRVIPEVASQAGYSFEYPELGSALRQILT